MRGTLFLEAALTHQRCLIEFVIGRPGKNHARAWKSNLDITPMTMSADWDPGEALGTAAVDFLQQHLTRIDRHLAHPSLERCSYRYDRMGSRAKQFGDLRSPENPRRATVRAAIVLRAVHRRLDRLG